MEEHRYQHNGTFQGGCMCGKSANDPIHDPFSDEVARQEYDDWVARYEGFNPTLNVWLAAWQRLRELACK